MRAPDEPVGDVLVAPDKFKGTYTAWEVAEAIGRGVRRAGRSVRLLPVADGGDGTAEVIRLALGGRRLAADVSDAIGRPLRAGFTLLDDGRAVVDVAEASGVGVLRPDERDALGATSRGTGELIAAAARAGAREVLVAAGGSACTDAGAGLLAAVREAGVTSLPVTVICDVRTPFERAPAVFGPQKGADPDDVAALERRLDAFARAGPRDPRGLPMTGAAGGLAGGLWAHLGATLVPGAAYVLDLLRFDARLDGASLVLTGEGRIDSQTAHGKAVSEVAGRARARDIDCVVLAGQDGLGAAAAAELGISTVVEACEPLAMESAALKLALKFN